MKTMQVVPMRDYQSLWIVDFDFKTSTLYFRTSRNPKYRQSEVVKVTEHSVIGNLYDFSVEFLNMFINNNIQYYPELLTDDGNN